jgi:hypothetical protein
MLIIPRNSLKFRLLVDSNPTFARSNVELVAANQAPKLIPFGLPCIHSIAEKRRL